MQRMLGPWETSLALIVPCSLPGPLATKTWPAKPGNLFHRTQLAVRATSDMGWM